MKNDIIRNDNLGKVRVDGDVYTKFDDHLKPREGSGKAYEPVTNCKGTYRNIEQLPHYAKKVPMMIQADVAPEHIGKSINDGEPETVVQVLEAALFDEQKGFMPEDELPMINRMIRSCEHRLREVRLVLQRKGLRQSRSDMVPGVDKRTSDYRNGQSIKH